jgi:hypothetical protein
MLDQLERIIWTIVRTFILETFPYLNGNWHFATYETVKRHGLINLGELT